MTSFKELVEHVVTVLNRDLRWEEDVFAAIPQARGKSLLLEVVGDSRGRWGLFVDGKEQRLKIVSPDLVPAPTAACRLDEGLAWRMLADCKTKQDLWGYYARYAGQGLISFDTSDGKMAYHADLLSWLWSELRAVALGEERP